MRCTGLLPLAASSKIGMDVCPFNVVVLKRAARMPTVAGVLGNRLVKVEALVSDVRWLLSVLRGTSAAHPWKACNCVPSRWEGQEKAALRFNWPRGGVADPRSRATVVLASAVTIQPSCAIAATSRDASVDG
mmetsp:Transcript_1154/g.4505  ORF Transcript_1154/g.4505 Transcript_1154/m.4505 type:complete len:132 (+) Transcript_1154:278-673(+)